jgi:hypothetical protein
VDKLLRIKKMGSGKIRGTAAGPEKDWKKFVSLVSPNAVCLGKISEDGKSASVIEIINKSDDVIIFNVTTTAP